MFGEDALTEDDLWCLSLCWTFDSVCTDRETSTVGQEHYREGTTVFKVVLFLLLGGETGS